MSELLEKTRFRRAHLQKKTAQLEQDPRNPVVLCAFLGDVYYATISLAPVMEEYDLSYSDLPAAADPSIDYYTVNGIYVLPTMRGHKIAMGLYLAANNEIKRIDGKLVRGWDPEKSYSRHGKRPTVMAKLAGRLWHYFVETGQAKVLCTIKGSKIPFTVMV